MRELYSRELIPLRADEGGHRRSPYVFRGADQDTWPLETSLKRLQGISSENTALIEQSLIRSFRKYASAGTFDDKSEWYVLAVAQHNGLPTRCLDWASSPLIAAHFACSDEARKTSDGVIWCLHVGALRDINAANNSATAKMRGIAWTFDTRLLESCFSDLAALDGTFQPDEPCSRLMLLWEPPSIHDRIATQSGLLSIMNSGSGSQQEFLDSYSERYPKLLKRIVIDSSAKSEIRDILDQNNVSERTLFPGLPGLCSWLKRYYGTAW